MEQNLLLLNKYRFYYFDILFNMIGNMLIILQMKRDNRHLKTPNKLVVFCHACSGVEMPYAWTNRLHYIPKVITIGINMTVAANPV